MTSGTLAIESSAAPGWYRTPDSLDQSMPSLDIQLMIRLL
jgi:hypothetical protein